MMLLRAATPATAMKPTRVAMLMLFELETGEDQPAHEGERDVAEHLDGEERRAEVAVEQEGDDDEDDAE